MKVELNMEMAEHTALDEPVLHDEQVLLHELVQVDPSQFETVVDPT